MVYQGYNHCARTNLWHKSLVAVLSYTVYFSYSSLGLISQGLAHTGGIQYHLDIHINNGTCSKPR
jgi:hypothetical protein